MRHLQLRDRRVAKTVGEEKLAGKLCGYDGGHDPAAAGKAVGKSTQQSPRVTLPPPRRVHHDPSQGHRVRGDDQQDHRLTAPKSDCWQSRRIARRSRQLPREVRFTMGGHGSSVLGDAHFFRGRRDRGEGWCLVTDESAQGNEAALLVEAHRRCVLFDYLERHPPILALGGFPHHASDQGLPHFLPAPGGRDAHPG